MVLYFILTLVIMDSTNRKRNIYFYLQALPNPALTTVGLGQSPNRTISILSSPNNVSLMGEDCIYMEMEKFNNTNEIYPFQREQIQCITVIMVIKVIRHLLLFH